MKKKVTIAFIIAVLVVIAATAGVTIYKNSTPVKLKTQLDLGNKYLLEENYELAVIEYTVAIEIDPMSVDAYIGLAKSYVGIDDLTKAVECLDMGINATGSEELKKQRDEIQKEIDRRIAEAKAKLEAEEKARKMKEEAELNEKRTEIIEADLDWFFENGFKIRGKNWDGESLATNNADYINYRNGRAIYDVPFSDSHYGDYIYTITNGSVGYGPVSPSKYSEDTDLFFYSEIDWEDTEFDNRKCMSTYLLFEEDYKDEFDIWDFINENQLYSNEDVKKRWLCPDEKIYFSIDSPKYGHLVVKESRETWEDVWESRNGCIPGEYKDEIRIYFSDGLFDYGETCFFYITFFNNIHGDKIVEIFYSEDKN